MQKKPNPIDVHVGTRVRLRRMLIGMSQERLGEQLGLTFQQVQKYEKGANRIGSSRLFKIAKILDVPIQFFFDDLPPELSGDAPPTAVFAEGDETTFVMDFVTTTEGLQLNRAFSRIADANVKRRVVDLVKALAGDRDNADG